MAATAIISLEKSSSRIYFAGNTYALKDQIKAIGGHWDGNRKQWWIGTVKAAEAEALVANAEAAPATRSPSKGREANEVRRQIAKQEKAAKWFWDNVRVRGSYRAACEAAQVRDEEEFIRVHANNCEVLWNPLTRTWM